MVTRLVRLYRIPIIRRIAWLINKMLGVDIPVSVCIGKKVAFPHNSVGTVIHPDTVIGNNVKIYQNVTIGRGDVWKNPSDDFDGFDIKDGAILCAGAKIISSHGKRVIGKNSIVGANAVVTENVPDNCIVGGVPARVLSERKE